MELLLALTPPNLLLDALYEPAKFGFGFDVFVPDEAYFGEVVVVLGANGGARHEGPGRVVLAAGQPAGAGQGGGRVVMRNDGNGTYSPHATEPRHYAVPGLVRGTKLITS